MVVRLGASEGLGGDHPFAQTASGAHKENGHDSRWEAGSQAYHHIVIDHIAIVI